MHTKYIASVIAIALLLVSGCGGGGGSSSSSLSSTAQSASNSAAQTAKMTSLIGRCMGGFVTGGANGVISVVGTPGVSPTVTVQVSGTTTTTTADYGTGVTSGTTTISGSVVTVFNTATNSGTITFHHFTDTTTHGTTILDGTIQFTITPGTGGVDTVSTQADLTFTDNGDVIHLTGSATFDVSQTTGLIDVSTANLTLTSAEGTLTSTATSLTFDSATHRVNGGSIHATYQPNGTSLSLSVTVTFTSETPSNGKVLVSVAGSPAVEAHVPVGDL